MKKTIKDFTPEIQSKIPEYITKYTKGIDNGERYYNFKFENAEKLINWNYEKCGFKKPVVLVVENIYEQQIFFNFIVANKEKYFPILYLIYNLKNNMNDEIKKFIKNLKKKNKGNTLYNTLYNTLDNTLDNTLKVYNNLYLFTTNVYSNAILAWWKFIKDEFKIDCGEIGITLDSWNDMYLESGVYSTIFSELLCVVSKYPKKICRDNNNNLHNTNGLAVEWGYIIEETKFDCYYIHGRQMPKQIFEKYQNNLLTKADFINETNEDVRGGIYEIIESKGEGEMMKFLGAIEVDRKTIKHAKGNEEFILYKTKEVFNEEQDLNDKSPAALAWLKMTCPSTGQNYLIPTDSSFTNCIDAAKYHRPDEIPKELEYFWNSRN